MEVGLLFSLQANWSLFCLFLVLLFTFTFTFKMITVRNSLVMTLPSPPNKLPIIGHLHLLTGMPHLTFTKLAAQLGHVPILSLQLGRVNTVVISSPHLARLVLKTHDAVFCDRPQLVSAQFLSFNCSDVTFSRYGPYWRQARRICVNELLSQKRVSLFHLVREEEVNHMLSILLSKSGSEVDLSKVLFDLANNVVCKVAFGRRFNDDDDEGQDGKLVQVLTETQRLFAGFCVGDFFPEWGWVNSVSGYKKRCMKNLKELRSVCDEIIINDHLKKKSNNINHHQDFVDVLLRVQQRDDLEVPISDDNLKALVLDMFVAGTDTTSATLEWTMTELARHPKVMRKAQEEVRRVAYPGGKIDETHLQQLHYTKAVIKEAMRLHPPVPLLVPRESMEKCILDDKYEIPAKTRVLVNAYAIGRDPESWQNPLQYDPERFLVNNMNIEYKDEDFRFLPFGGGRRGCPGFAFGLATVEIALARLLCHLDWALPHGLGSDDVDLTETFGLATRKRLSLVLIPTAHAHAHEE